MLSIALFFHNMNGMISLFVTFEGFLKNVSVHLQNKFNELYSFQPLNLVFTGKGTGHMQRIEDVVLILSLLSRQNSSYPSLLLILN